MIIYGDGVYGMLGSLEYQPPPPPLSVKQPILRKKLHKWQVVVCNIQSNHLHPETVLYRLSK